MLLTRLDVGWAETLALRLTRALASRGIEMVVAGVQAGGTMGEAFAEHALAVHEALARSRRDLLGPWRVRGLIRRYDTDVVLVVDAVRNAMLCGLWGSRLSGRRVGRVVWVHACGGHGEAEGRMTGFLADLRRYAKAMDAVVTIAPWQREEFAQAGIPPERMTTIANGIELPAPAAPTGVDRKALRQEFGAGEESLLIVQVANYWPEKDPAWLLESFGRAAATHPELRLALVGRGMDSPAIRHQAEQLAPGLVATPGHRDDVPAILGAADAFVLATRHETLPMSVLEAMAAGKPIVVSDLPAFDEMLTDGQDALTCPVGDVGALAGAFSRLADEPGLRNSLSRAAAARVRHYSMDRMADRFARLLRSAGAAT